MRGWGCGQSRTCKCGGNCTCDSCIKVIAAPTPTSTSASAASALAFLALSRLFRNTHCLLFRSTRRLSSYCFSRALLSRVPVLPSLLLLCSDCSGSTLCRAKLVWPIPTGLTPD